MLTLTSIRSSLPMRHLSNKVALIALFATTLCGCAGSQANRTHLQPTETSAGKTAPTDAADNRQAPPASGPARDVVFPPVVRDHLANHLEVNAVMWQQLPLVDFLIVIRDGNASDPERLPGLAQMTAALLKEGSKKRNSAQLAEAIEYLGASFNVSTDADSMIISMHTLREHAEEALEIVAEVITQPAFSEAEFEKLRKRELDRLALQNRDPEFLAAREFYARLYGKHPYAHIDATVDSIKAMKRKDIVDWYKKHVHPDNAFLVAVGDLPPTRVHELASKTLSSWKAGTSTAKENKEPLAQTYPAREIIIIDRPESVQSVITMGNIALARNNPDYITLRVANQVLGGSASSRLFMDLREKRSLTYGAYSAVGSRQQSAPFLAHAAVRAEVTEEAVGAFVEHLERITTATATDDELVNAKRFLSDSFPLKIDTPDKIARLLADLRIYHLPDSYYETYRSDIRNVQKEEALNAAKRYIKADKGLVVIVGNAQAIAEPLKKFGSVQVIKP